MGAVFTVLVLFGGIALIVGLIGLGAHLLDSRELGQAVRKRRVRELEKALHVVDEIARDSLTVNPGDITALQVAGAINKARRAL